MFDSVLQTQNLPRARFGVGFTVTVIVHVSVLLLAVWTSTRKHRVEATEVNVSFVRGPQAAPPPPPPPPAHHKTTHKVTPKPHPVVQSQIIQPKEVPQEKPPEPSADDLADDEDGVEGGVEGGVAGGVVGGVVGGVLGGTGRRIEFDENQMARPVMVSGRNVEYTDQALEHEIEGTIVVKCVLTVEGAVHDCRVLRGLPFMDRAVVDALQSRHYKPVTYRGQPVEVDYTFNIKLSLPR